MGKPALTQEELKKEENQMNQTLVVKFWSEGWKVIINGKEFSCLYDDESFGGDTVVDLLEELGHDVEIENIE